MLEKLTKQIMKWITREKVKVDRVACPWLIQKFIDPQAEFLFVPSNEVETKAKELGATPFDVPKSEAFQKGLARWIQFFS